MHTKSLYFCILSITTTKYTIDYDSTIKWEYLRYDGKMQFKFFLWLSTIRWAQSDTRIEMVWFPFTILNAQEQRDINGIGILRR